MKITVEVDEKELRRIVLRHLQEILRVELVEKDVLIEVKSKQNYKSEWEPAEFRARVEKNG